ncbi:translation initiation factor eIF-2B subunit epsilon [Trichodelitschia bisporula]|uniref:Mannose-1-phosphate guanyltransferase n=1 Tax=Trichodelitschia bisporula TaxID=703511 RepID=A0A6G1I2M5_9PEZI|nr:translation initiation factor eIF-2B subunit epsilon [Trichodelitschia bisporula]
MAKKPAAAADKGRKPAKTEEREELLQAVILADSFETRFTPFTLERPRCLLPLANVPLIEYTLEFLANAKVDEVYVYCAAHTEQVEEYIHKSKWSTTTPKSLSPFKSLELIRSTSRSMGDAMRDLDKRDILTNDFIVVYGDVIANIAMQPALDAHRARREKDKNAIMTMVLREAELGHRTRAMGVEPIWMIDPSKNRVLHYEQITGDPDHIARVEPEVLDCPELIVHTDLIDCGIDICTPDALALWSDNFDFQAPRRNYLYSVLKDYDLNGKTIHTHIINQGYAARVRNLRTYDAVTRDVLERWAYPICPDTNLLRSQSYRYQRGCMYKEQNVMLARTCVVGRHSVLGEGTRIGDGSVVESSVLGRKCEVGKNVTIENSFIWGDVVIGDGSVIRRAVIANGVVIGKGCTILPGALLSYGVRIADGVIVRAERRITTTKRRRHDEDSAPAEKGSPDAEIVGRNGDGFEYHDSEDEDEDLPGLKGTGLVYSDATFAVSIDSISSFNDFDDEESDLEDRPKRTRSAGSSFLSIASDDSHDAGMARDFHHEAANSLLDGLQRGDLAANMALELSALRLSTNASEHQVRRAVVSAFMKRIVQLVEGGGSIAQTAKEVLTPCESLISRTMFDRGDESSEKPDQHDFLLLLQQDLSHRKDGDLIFLHVLKNLVALDVVEAEGALQWFEDEKSREGDDMLRIREKATELVEYLNEEESSGEEESEEDED